MGVETARSGTIPLKEGVTLADAVQLWLTRAGGAGDEPPAPGQDSWTDDYTVFRLYGANLDYEFNGESGWYADQVEAWLGDAESELAGAAWYDTDRSFEGMGDEALYGPSERAKLELKIFSARIQIQDLQRQLDEDEAELETLDE